MFYLSFGWIKFLFIISCLLYVNDINISLIFCAIKADVCLSSSLLSAARDHQEWIASEAPPPALAQLLPRVSGKICVYIPAAAQEVSNRERRRFLFLPRGLGLWLYLLGSNEAEMKAGHTSPPSFKAATCNYIQPLIKPRACLVWTGVLRWFTENGCKWILEAFETCSKAF